MKIFYTFFFLLFLCLASSSKLTFKPDQTVIDNNKEWSRIKVGVQGGEIPLTYYYDEFPQGWKQVKDYLYAPKKTLESKRKFPCRIRVQDKNGEQEKGTIVLFSDENNLKIDGRIYKYDVDFELDFFDSDGFFGIPQMKTNLLAVSSKNKLNIKKIDEKYKNNLIEMHSIAQKPGSGLAGLSDLLDRALKQSGDELKLQLAFRKRKNLLQKQDQSIRSRYIGRIIGLGKRFRNSQYPFEKYAKDKYNIKNTFENVNKDKTYINRFSTSNSHFQPLLENRGPKLPIYQQKKHIRTYFPYNKQQISQKNQGNQPNLTINRDNNQFNILKQILKDQNLENSSRRSINQIFSKFPSSQELDQIILGADGYAILKTLQTVLQSDLNCENKYSYLADFLARIRSAIQMKSYASSQLSLIIQFAKKQIKRLDDEISKNEQMKVSLNIDEFKEQLQKELQKLQYQYDLFNDIQIKIEPNKVKIKGYELDIKNIRKFSVEIRQKIQADKLQMIEIDSQITTLQRNLANAKLKKQDKNQQIQKFNWQLSENNRRVQENQQQILKLEKQIDQLQAKSDQVKISYTTLQIKVDRMSQDIEELVSKQNAIQGRLQYLYDKRKQQQDKLVVQQLSKINNMVETLKDRVPSIQEQVDRTYFSCHNLSSIETEKQNQNLIYLIQPQNYTKYLESSYGDTNIKPTLSGSSQIKLLPVDILSKQWELNYGSPYTNEQIAKSAQFSFENDFECKNSDKFVNGQGKIQEIKKKSIEVRSQNGQKLTLNLGACSRLQSVEEMPKKGQKILFRATQAKNRQQFNLFRASCL